MKNKALVIFLSILLVIMLIAMVGMGAYMAGIMQGGGNSDGDDDPASVHPDENEDDDSDEDEDEDKVEDKDKDKDTDKETKPDPTEPDPTEPEPTEPEPEFIIPVNSAEDAAVDVFTVLYDESKHLNSSSVQNLAPEAYWKNAETTPQALTNDFQELMQPRQDGWDDLPRGDEIKIPGYQFPAPNYDWAWIKEECDGRICTISVVDSYQCSRNTLSSLQNELNRKYGIPKESILGAEEVSLEVTYVIVDDVHIKEITPTVTVVQIGDRWYVYDQGMFYPHLLSSITQSSSGYNYLMNASWLN